MRFYAGWRARSALPLFELAASAATTLVTWNGLGFGVASIFLGWRIYSFFKIGEWAASMVETTRAIGSALDYASESVEDVRAMHEAGELDVLYMLALTCIVTGFAWRATSGPNASVARPRPSDEWAASGSAEPPSHETWGAVRSVLHHERCPIHVAHAEPFPATSPGRFSMSDCILRAF